MMENHPQRLVTDAREVGEMPVSSPLGDAVEQSVDHPIPFDRLGIGPRPRAPLGALR